ncbi:MAG: AAA family ATPase [Burkholderiaceae bacterium]|nr:AAA family ATPase [Burkholderiaceae bacterium]
MSSRSTGIPRPELLGDVIARVGAGLVERERQARCLVLAALCGEHVLFIGPPGTAKSELARRLHRVVGGRYFERLLTRFTVPEELFGPLSLAALDEGRYERDIDGYLPTASIAFLDEVFKANSAILNALLTLLNEREFDQGVHRIAVPLACVVAASNEVPEEEALRAFFDRFLFRCAVPPVSEEGFAALLAHIDAPPGDGPQLSGPELAATQREAAHVPVPLEIRDALIDLRAFLAERSIEASDRRWVRIVRALRIAALGNARTEVETSDLWVLTLVVPERAEQAELIERWFAERLGAAQPVDPKWLRRVVEAFTRQVELEGSASELAFDDSGKLSLMTGLGGADPEAIGEAAPRMSAFSRRKRFSATHVRARIAQVDAVLRDVDAYLARASHYSAETLAALRANLWVPAEFALAVESALTQSRDSVGELREGLLAARRGFASLALDELDDGRAPHPVELGD